MIVTDIAIEWFRSYRQAVIKLHPGVNVFLGANGQGKTNLVEALNYLAVLSSHRIGTDSALVHYSAVDGGAHAGVIRAKIGEGNKGNKGSKAQSENSKETGNENSSKKEDEDSATVNVVEETEETSRAIKQEKTPETGSQRTELLEIEIIAGKANRAMINRHKTRPRDLLGHLSTVMFSPEDLELIEGTPEKRRDFVDQIAVQIHPSIAQTFTDLTKTLRQRAAYLREVVRRHGKIDPIQIGIWDEALAPLTAKVMQARAEIVQALNQTLPKIYAQIAGENPENPHRKDESNRENPENNTKDTSNPGSVNSVNSVNAAATNTGKPNTGKPDILTNAEIKYRDNISKTLNLSETQRNKLFHNPTSLKAQILHAFQTHHGEEAVRGQNLTGTHRDEIELKLLGFPVKGYASHGEMWTFALSLRLAEFYFLCEKRGETPVLLLDDVFTELDKARRRAVLGAIKTADQVWVTSALGTELPPELKAKFYRIQLNERRESEITEASAPWFQNQGNKNAME